MRGEEAGLFWGGGVSFYPSNTLDRTLVSTVFTLHVHIMAICQLKLLVM